MQSIIEIVDEFLDNYEPLNLNAILEEITNVKGFNQYNELQDNQEGKI